MSVRVSQRGILRQIRVDALRRVHNVGFLAGRFISVILEGQNRYSRSHVCQTGTMLGYVRFS